MVFGFTNEGAAHADADVGCHSIVPYSSSFLLLLG
jgi:hypothetical protein